jgi:sodium/potassium-transporting ATPase subunit alpha
MAIAQQVGIITNPISSVKHLDDLQEDMPIEDVPLFNPDKEPGDAVSSLVLSGSEMMTMTKSQWAQVLAVSIDNLLFFQVPVSDLYRIQSV